MSQRYLLHTSRYSKISFPWNRILVLGEHFLHYTFDSRLPVHRQLVTLFLPTPFLSKFISVITHLSGSLLRLKSCRLLDCFKTTPTCLLHFSSNYMSMILSWFRWFRWFHLNWHGYLQSLPMDLPFFNLNSYSYSSGPLVSLHFCKDCFPSLRIVGSLSYSGRVRPLLRVSTNLLPYLSSCHYPFLSVPVY